jgi:DNA ligase (NAD+)
MLVHGIGAWAQPQRDEAPVDSQSATYGLRKQWGLPTSSHFRVMTNASQGFEFIEYYGAHRSRCRTRDLTAS